MTTLFEVRIRAGGDPRGFIEYEMMREELGKLSHPACPVVDWLKVEQLCLALFSKNGAELQTVASYTLARTQLHGLEGMLEGIGLIEMAVCDWSSLWPPIAPARVEVLAWLFAQLQLLLRGVVDTAVDQPGLIRLDAKLDNLHRLLLRRTQTPVITLQALRQQIGNQLRRLDRAVATVGLLQPVLSARPAAFAAPSFSSPLIALTGGVLPELPAAYVKPKRRWLFLWLFAALMWVALLGWMGWLRWLADPTNAERSILATILQQDHNSTQPVHLDSLMLFEAGSDQLNAGSTKLLINALDGIKARPDWLIVITGHSDMTGDAEQNLQLSRSRASAVRDWMQGMSNIPDSCFAINGVAASQPVASNDSASGRAANRRVDIRLVPQMGGCS